MIMKYTMANRTDFLADVMTLYDKYPLVEVEGDSHLPSVYISNYYDKKTKVNDKHFKLRVPKAWIGAFEYLFSVFEDVITVALVGDIDEDKMYRKLGDNRFHSNY